MSDKSLKNYEALVVIPARGGSKGVKNKNIREVGGKPLVVHSIEACYQINNCLVVVSTDDSRIAEISQEYGAVVPFLRPAELSGDYISPTEAVYYTLQKLLEHSYQFNFVVQLQPTYFYRSNSLLQRCINCISSRDDADCLITVRKVEDTSHPDFIGTVSSNGFLNCKSGDLFRRQDLNAQYAFFGSVMIARQNFLLDKKTFFGKRLLPFPVESQLECMDINTPIDLLIADAVMRTEKISKQIN